mmetsp:Transcript_21257/g.59920  ORF Transcript_21257/g.59920 Transcript_21257/m.59920 type:complete len:216 (-) Transcript_21257:481-1128(-)
MLPVTSALTRPTRPGVGSTTVGGSNIEERARSTGSVRAPPPPIPMPPPAGAAPAWVGPCTPPCLLPTAASASFWRPRLLWRRELDTPPAGPPRLWLSPPLDTSSLTSSALPLAPAPPPYSSSLSDEPASGSSSAVEPELPEPEPLPAPFARERERRAERLASGAEPAAALELPPRGLCALPTLPESEVASGDIAAPAPLLPPAPLPPLPPPEDCP